MAFFVFLVSNFVLAFLATIITVFVAPAASGSGIPEIKAYLNGVDAPGVLSLPTLIVKVNASIVFFSFMLFILILFS